MADKKTALQESDAILAYLGMTKDPSLSPEESATPAVSETPEDLEDQGGQAKDEPEEGMEPLTIPDQAGPQPWQRALAGEVADTFPDNYKAQVSAGRFDEAWSAFRKARPLMDATLRDEEKSSLEITGDAVWAAVKAAPGYAVPALQAGASGLIDMFGRGLGYAATGVEAAAVGALRDANSNPDAAPAERWDRSRGVVDSYVEEFFTDNEYINPANWDTLIFNSEKAQGVLETIAVGLDESNNAVGAAAMDWANKIDEAYALGLTPESKGAIAAIGIATWDGILMAAPFKTFRRPLGKGQPAPTAPPPPAELGQRLLEGPARRPALPPPETPFPDFPGQAPVKLTIPEGPKMLAAPKAALRLEDASHASQMIRKGMLITSRTMADRLQDMKARRFNAEKPRSAEAETSAAVTEYYAGDKGIRPLSYDEWHFAVEQSWFDSSHWYFKYLEPRKAESVRQLDPEGKQIISVKRKFLVDKDLLKAATDKTPDALRDTPGSRGRWQEYLRDIDDVNLNLQMERAANTQNPVPKVMGEWMMRKSVEESFPLVERFDNPHSLWDALEADRVATYVGRTEAKWDSQAQGTDMRLADILARSNREPAPQGEGAGEFTFVDEAVSRVLEQREVTQSDAILAKTEAERLKGVPPTPEEMQAVQQAKQAAEQGGQQPPPEPPPSARGPSGAVYEAKTAQELSQKVDTVHVGDITTADLAHQMRTQVKENVLEDSKLAQAKFVRTEWDPTKGPSEAFLRAQKKSQGGFIEVGPNAVSNLVKRLLDAAKAHKATRGKNQKQTLQSAWTDSQRLWDMMGEMFLGSKGITPLRRAAASVEKRLGRRSKLADLLDDLEAPEFGQQVKGRPHTRRSIHEQRDINLGYWVSGEANPWSMASIWNKHIKNLPRLLGKVSQKGLDALYKGTMEDLLTKTTPETALGKDLRVFYDRVYKWAESQGFPVATYLDKYLPRVWSARAISKSRGAWDAMLLKNRLSPDMALELTENLLQNDGVYRPVRAFSWQRVNVRGSRKARHLEFERVLKHLKPEDIIPFLEPDLNKLTYKYVRQTVDAVDEFKRFGRDEELLAAKWVEAAQEAGATQTVLPAVLQKRYMDIKDIAYDQRFNINPKLRGLIKAGITIGNWALLPYAAVVSIAEASVVMKNPVFRRTIYKAAVTEATAGAAHQMLRAIKRDIPPRDVQAIASDIGKASSASTMERLTAIHGGVDVNSWLGSMAFQVNGLHAWTNFMYRMTANSFDRSIREFLTDEAASRAGKPLSANRRNAHMQQREHWEHYGVDLNKGVQWLEAGGKLKGEFYRSGYQTALTRISHQTVMQPRAGNVPMWHHIPQLAWIRHLTTFPTIYGNTVMKSVWTDTVAFLDKSPHRLWMASRSFKNQLAFIVTSFLLADLSEQLVEISKYGKEGPKDPTTSEERFMQAIDRAGFGGAAGAKLFPSFGGKFKADTGRSALGPEFSYLFEALDASIEDVGKRISRGEKPRYRNAARHMVRALPAETPLTPGVPFLRPRDKAEEAEWIDALEQFMVENMGGEYSPKSPNERITSRQRQSMKRQDRKKRREKRLEKRRRSRFKPRRER